ncbi:MAG: hypothetical protein Q7K55_07480 [Candidatus Levybacteria bacterium]|nr:hypothetical protein [Candidatus Levybacteria bacterium]
MSEQNRVKTLIRIVTIALSGILIVFVFNNQLFSLNGIIGGDWPYFFPEQLREFPLIPYSWSSSTNLGSPTVSPWIDTYLNSVVYLFFNKFGLSWILVQKIFFFFIPILLSTFSITILWRALFKKFSLIPLFIYIFNTYFLMLYGGGQMGVVLAYSVAPLVLASFIKTINYSNFNEKIKDHPFDKLRAKIKDAIFAGLVLALQVLFDPRIAYITMIAVFILMLSYILSDLLGKKKLILNTLYFHSCYDCYFA